jgi:hypothetical protein
VQIDLDQLSLRLGRPVPRLYVEFVGRCCLEDLSTSLASPAAICAVNLEARKDVPAKIARTSFFLYQQDTGDYFLMKDEQPKRIYSWSHENEETSSTDIDPADLLNELSHVSTPELTVDSGLFVVSRTKPWSHSMLEPITQAEMADAAADLYDVKCFDHVVAQNPFTSQPMRIETPGVAFEAPNAKRFVFHLRHGRLTCHGGGFPLPQSVRAFAARLRAHIFPAGANNAMEQTR